MEPPREDYHYHNNYYHHHHHGYHHPDQHLNYFQPPPLPPPGPYPYPQSQPPPPPQPQPPPQHYFNHNYEHHQFNSHNFDYHANFDTNQPMTGPPNEPVPGPFFSNGRKRGRYHSGRASSPDCTFDAGGYVKLFVAPVPIPISMESISALFEAHGGVVEIVLPRDKKSGQQQGYGFVKYATVEEADRAIRALNGQYTMPGETCPLKVRYADKDRERPAKVEREIPAGGEFVEKLYVGGINRQASEQEIEEIFSPYGRVEDIFVVRDNLKQSRGCAFVKLSHRDMALAAIKALHGTFTMRGSDQPLVVRFADPPKRRPGDSRGNYGFGGQNLGPCSLEPINRPSYNFGDSVGGCLLPNASYPMQESFSNSQPLDHSNPVKSAQDASQMTMQSLFPVKQQPAQLSHMPPQPGQGPEKLLQSSQQYSERTKQAQNLEQQQSSASGGGSFPVTNDTSAHAVPPSPQTDDPLECDWSEHSCPDGYKYYFNCTTCESSWEQPEEFTLYQRKMQKQQKTSTSQQSYSLSTGSVEEADQTSSVINSTPSSLPTDLDHMKIQSETSQVVDPTCV